MNTVYFHFSHYGSKVRERVIQCSYTEREYIYILLSAGSLQGLLSPRNGSRAPSAVMGVLGGLPSITANSPREY